MDFVSKGSQLAGRPAGFLTSFVCPVEDRHEIDTALGSIPTHKGGEHVCWLVGSANARCRRCGLEWLRLSDMTS